MRRFRIFGTGRRHGVGSRLALGFGALLALLSLIAFGGLWRLQQVSDSAINVLDRRVPHLALVQDGAAELNRLNVAARDALLHTDPSDLERQLQVIEQGRAEIGKRIELLHAAFTADDTPQAKQAAEEFAQQSSGILIALVKFSRTVKSDKAAATDVLEKLLQPKLQNFSRALAAFQADEMHQLEQSKQQMMQSRKSNLLLTAAGMAMALLVGVAAAVVITRSITVPLQRAVSVADRVARGDLSGAIESGRDDELGRLLSALSRMQASLTATVAQVRSGCETVAGASADIARGNSEQSDRTEQQASSLQQTAAAMEQLGTTVRQNADNAQRADRLARNASDVAQRGGEVVDQVVTTMKGIDDSSRRIADITNLIDGIAFQTNILALNAAVEAARAGDHGRGFAVVAAEVRSLAQRSAQAAKEIKALIDDSVTRVESGSRLVDEAGRTMHEIVGAIVEVSRIVGQISHASSEQTSGIAQVGQAVTDMDRSTQANAGLVAHTATAAEQLKQQARQLVEAVAVFRLAHVAEHGIDDAHIGQAAAMA